MNKPVEPKRYNSCELAIIRYISAGIVTDLPTLEVPSSTTYNLYSHQNYTFAEIRSIVKQLEELCGDGDRIKNLRIDFDESIIMYDEKVPNAIYMPALEKYNRELEAYKASLVKDEAAKKAQSKASRLAHIEKLKNQLKILEAIED